MKINIDFSQLHALAKKMGLSTATFIIDAAEAEFEPIDIDLGDDGILIESSDVEVTGSLLAYKGRQVLLYIKDHSYGMNFENALVDGKKGNKFHVAYCTTLEQMMERKRYQRYVATNNLSGNFKIAANGKGEGIAQLQVCQNCLDLLNYKGSRGNRSLKQNNVITFDLKEFFATYSSKFKFMPKYTENSKIGYSADWGIISKQKREMHRYICEECLVDMSSQKALCHVHHRNGVKNDNSEENLQVLCADCHRRAHEGSMHLSHEDMVVITRLRNNQSIISENANWDNVLQFVDPALKGELELLRRAGYSAPKLGVNINNVILDVAWVSIKQGISIKKEIIPGWNISLAGDYLS